MIANEVSIYLFPALRSIMVEEKPQFELIRLRKEQTKLGTMRSSGVCRPQNEQHTTEGQSGFTNCKATFRQARSLKRVYSLQRQS